MNFNKPLLLLILPVFFYNSAAALAQVASGSFCQVPLVGVNNLKVDCPQGSRGGDASAPRRIEKDRGPILKKSDVNRAFISFSVGNTGEIGKIEITQFTPDVFKVESFLDGKLMASTIHTISNTNISFSPAFLRRAAGVDDIGVQALSSVLARQEVITPIFECLSRPLIQFGLCQAGCAVAGSLLRAACAIGGAGIAAVSCVETLGLGCAAAIGAASVCVDLADGAESGCIQRCG